MLDRVGGFDISWSGLGSRGWGLGMKVRVGVWGSEFVA